MNNVKERRPETPVVFSGGKGWTRAQCLRALKRRRDWLESRCAVRQDSGTPVFLDEQELASLKWVLELIENPIDTET